LWCNMTTAQAIAQHVLELPEAEQREVLDFVEFLEAKAKPGVLRERGGAWSAFALAAAMRGMEDEPSPYTTADLKETFR
ncbi:MAG: DUF2281 domain-containing protein, partial [Verrucomicrobiota bacterium]